MWGANFTVEEEAPRTPGQRLAAGLTGLRAWATSETGGWIIVGVLAVCVLVAAAILLVMSRLNSNAGETSSARPVAAQAQTGAVPDLTDFTLAPDEIQDMSFDQARIWNAGLPFSTEAIRPATRFIAPTTDIESYGRALDCLTAAWLSSLAILLRGRLRPRLWTTPTKTPARLRAAPWSPNPTSAVRAWEGPTPLRRASSGLSSSPCPSQQVLRFDAGLPAVRASGFRSSHEGGAADADQSLVAMTDALRIPRKTLYDKFRRHDLRPGDFRTREAD